MKRLSTTRLDRLRELRVLAHPLRLQLLNLFADGPRTTKQAAELLGGGPTRLYHHVHALERAGLIRVTSRRQVRGTVEKTYQAAATRFGVDRGLAAGKAGGAAIASMFDLRAELAAALAARRSGRRTQHLAARATMFLDDRQASALRTELIGRLEKLSTDEQRRSRGRLRPWTLTIALLPAAGEPEPGGPRQGAAAAEPARRGRRPRRRAAAGKPAPRPGRARRARGRRDA